MRYSCAKEEQLPTFLQKVPKNSNAIKIIINPDDELAFQRCAVYSMATPRSRRNFIQFPERWKKKAAELGKRIGAPGVVTLRSLHIFCFLYPDWGVTIFSDLETALLRLYPERGPKNIVYCIFHTVSDSRSEDELLEQMNDMMCIPTSSLRSPAFVEPEGFVMPENAGMELKKGHYHLIVDPSRLIHKKIFCNLCGRSLHYLTMRTHKCQETQRLCISCQTRFVDMREWQQHRYKSEIFKCPTCNHKCYGAECLKTHQEKYCNKKYSLCQKCGVQLHAYKNASDHICGVPAPCPHCEIPGGKGHRCFLKVYKKPETTKKYWVFDIETDPTNGAHKGIAVAYCPVGFSNEEHMEYISGEDCLLELAQIMQEEQETPVEVAPNKFQKVEHIWIAHNGAGYDFHLMKKPLADVFGKLPTQVENGTKLLYVEFNRKIRLVDSCRHFSIPLEKCPSTFNFSVQLGPDFIKCGRKKFTPFDDLQELRETLLFASNKSFSEMYDILKAEDGGNKGFYPYTFVAPGTIGPIPDMDHFGYARMNPGKKERFEEWYAQNEDVDWDYDANLKFYCELDVKILNRAVTNYKRFMEHIADLDPLRYPTAPKFASRVYLTHHIPKQPSHPHLSVLAALTKDEDLFARRGLNGGRTDVFNCKVFLTDEMIQAGFEIKDYDINSMYPGVQNKAIMPTGVPYWMNARQIKRDREKKKIRTLNKWIMQLEKEGFLEVDVEINKSELYPVLPAYRDGKVNWTCHNITKDVFALPELRDGIQDDSITVTAIHKALLFKEKRDDLYASYIRTFYPIKTHASKPPKMDLKKFCEEAKELHNLDFNPDLFEPNDGMKYTAKLLCNSLWGKMGQRTFDKTEFVDLIRFFKLLDMEAEGKIRKLREEIVGDDMIKAHYQSLFEDDKQLKEKNVAVAAYVTSHARVLLRSYMKKIGDKLIGCDTDSTWFLFHKKEGPHIQLGPHIKNMEDEYPKNIIYAAIATGAKSYAFRMIRRGHELPGVATTSYVYLKLCCNQLDFPDLIFKTIFSFINIHVEDAVKCKGVSLRNPENVSKVTYTAMKELVEDNNKKIENCEGPQMKRQRVNGAFTEIFMNKQFKCVQFTANKRIRPAPKFVGLYPPGYLLPLGHEHALGSEQPQVLGKKYQKT